MYFYLVMAAKIMSNKSPYLSKEVCVCACVCVSVCAYMWVCVSDGERQ